MATLPSVGNPQIAKPPSTIEFTWADAWILLSIIYRGGESGATLGGIIETGDAINHAIFNYGELDDGLSRLIEAGHIIRVKDSFRASAAMVAAYEKLSRRPGSPVTQMERLQNFLGATPWDKNYVPPTDGSTRVVTRDAFDVALAGYIEKFKRCSQS
jgi:hypothetical protein